ncbi:hypothetical protein TNCV_2375971 [Trichonephila clavipes]|nr:hypothetical protein TNCV_2375971 [Trichonephila clavipes]
MERNAAEGRNIPVMGVQQETSVFTPIEAPGIVGGKGVRAVKASAYKIPYMLDGIEIREIMPANPYVLISSSLRAVRQLLCDDMVHCRP